MISAAAPTFNYGRDALSAGDRLRSTRRTAFRVRAEETSRMKREGQQLWDYHPPAWAGKFLDEWCRQTMRSRIEPMKKIARSSGVVEGMNNKAKVTMRKSYGFRTDRVLEPALYHTLGKLPEPESNHDLF